MSAFLHSTHGPGTANANTTNYIHIGDTDGNEFIDTTEANTQVPYRTAGVSSLLDFWCITNGVTASSTVKLRIGAASGTQVISIGSSLTGEFVDSTHTDTVASGNLLNYQLVTGATGTSLTWYRAMHLYTPNSGSMMKLVCDTGAGLFRTNATNGFAVYFDTVSGQLGSDQTETDGPQYTVKVAGTWKNMAVSIKANTLNITQTMTSRKNAAPGSLTISVANNATGIFEDTTHSDSIIVGDLICYRYDMGQTGNAGGTSFLYEASEFVPTNQLTMAYLTQNLQHAPSLGSTQFAPAQGALGWNNSQYSTLMHSTGTMSLLGLSVNTNAQAGAVSYQWRKNGVNGNQVLSITASTTGYFEDTTHSDAVVPTDEVDVGITTAASGNFFASTQTMVLALPVAPLTNFSYPIPSWMVYTA